VPVEKGRLQPLLIRGNRSGSDAALVDISDPSNAAFNVDVWFGHMTLIVLASGVQVLD
jgi:hypothetical protein